MAEITNFDLASTVSADQLWAVLDEIPARVSFIDAGRRHAYVNHAYAAQFGLSVDDILGRTVAEIYGEDEDLKLRPFADAAMRGETVRWQGWVKFPGDVKRYIERVYQPHRGGAEIVDGFFVLVRDSTEHQQAESEQRRLSGLFRDAIESIPNGFVVYGPDRRVALCNAAFADMIDSDPGQLIGRSPVEILRESTRSVRSYDGLPMADHEDWLEYMMARYDSASRESVEIELADNRWMEISIHPSNDGSRVGIRTDITAFKRMQAALQEGEARVRQVIEACPVPVGMIRADSGEVIYENPAARALMASGPQSELATNAADYYASRDDHARHVALLRERGLVDEYEVELKRADGTTFWGSVTSRLIDYRGDPVVVYGAVDLTERRAVETEMARQREALYQSEKLNALGGLLAGVAHELNNPLSVVVGQSLMLNQEAGDPGLVRRAEKIGTAADRCARIVKTFLAMARQSSPARCKVDLNQVVEAAIEITGYALRSSDVEVVLTAEENLPAVWADPDQLHQVVTNLVINAEQAMAEQVGRGRLEISTFSDAAAGTVCMSVSDNGPGIPSEVRSRIFEPFFTTKAVGVGTGVGLSVSHGIVEAHQGRIGVDSPPGSGATFTISLPQSLADAGTEDDHQLPLGTAVTGRVLIVDDESEVAEMLADMLAPKGHEIEIADSGNAAMRILAHRRFDAIVSDMRMPDVDGAGLYKRIKNAYPDLLGRIVFITGDSLRPGIRSFLRETGVPCLEKPFTAEEVQGAVNRAIGGAA